MKQVEMLKYGDIVIIYRTAENGKSAEYSAVATSVCVIEEVKNQNEFNSFEEFYRYIKQYSVLIRMIYITGFCQGGCKAIK